MKNKIIITIIIILGIVLVAFSLFSMSDNQINGTNETATTTESALLDTSGWQTCRNEEYGYEFKYPKDWYIYERMIGIEVEVESSSVTEIDSCQGKLLVLSQKLSVRGGWYPPTISVSVFDDNWGNSLEEYLQKFDTEIFPVVVTKEETVGGVKIIKYTRQSSPHAILLYKKRVIGVTITTEDKKQNEFLNKVLSTFKFID